MHNYIFFVKQTITFVIVLDLIKIFGRLNYEKLGMCDAKLQ